MTEGELHGWQNMCENLYSSRPRYLTFVRSRHPGNQGAFEATEQMGAPVGVLGRLTPAPSHDSTDHDSSSPRHPHPTPALSTTSQRHGESVLPAHLPQDPFLPPPPPSLLSDPAHRSRPVAGPASGGTHPGPDNGYTSPLSPTQPFTRPRPTDTDRPPGVEPGARDGGGGSGGVGGWSKSDPLHPACEARAGAASLSAENNPGGRCRWQSEVLMVHIWGLANVSSLPLPPLGHSTWE